MSTFTSPPVSEEIVFKTGNRELILFLRIKGINPVRTETIGRRKLFCYNPDDIRIGSLDKEWLSGDPILVDIRRIFEAEKWFNSMVHDSL